MNTQIFKQSAQACAISVLCVQPTFAETGNAFIDDASVSGKIRTVYYNVENTDAPSENDENLSGAWTGALWINIESGYLNDMFAIGASAYSVTKFHTLNDRDTGSKQLLLDGNKGFSRLGETWADFKFGHDDRDISGHARVGRQIMSTGLISGSGSRSVPTVWQGINFESKIYGTTFNMAWVNEIMLRNDDKFRKLVNFDNPRARQIDYIWSLGLSHTLSFSNDQSLNLKYRNAFSKDFLQAHNIEVKWTMPIHEEMDLSLGGKVYYAKKDGNLWTGTVYGSKAFDDDATVGSLVAGITTGSWTFDAAITKVRAEKNEPRGDAWKYTPPGMYYYDLGKNTHGIFDIPTSAYSEDFIYDNELAWTVGANVNMTKYGVPGLNLGYAYIHGSDIEVFDPTKFKNVDTSESEHDFLVQYDFPDPVKGLTFTLKYAIYRNDKALRKAIEREKNDLRIWLDYDFVLF